MMVPNGTMFYIWWPINYFNSIKVYTMNMQDNLHFSRNADDILVSFST